MKRIFLSLAVFLLLFSVSPVFGQVEVQEDGVTIGGSAIRLNFRGAEVSGEGTDKDIQVGLKVEIVTATEDTVTTADSPRRFISTGTSAFGLSTFTLPTAATGLEYAFSDGVGTTTVAHVLKLQPQSGDNILYGNPPLDDGDKLNSSGATGDSVHIVGGSGVWYVVGMGSEAWVDGGL